MAKNSPHRSRRSVFDQMVTLHYSLERFVSMRGPNKQWIDLPKDQKDAFKILQSFLGPVISAYEGWLWDQAVRQEAAAKAKGKKNFVPNLPDNLLKKYEAVKDYADYAGKKMTLVVEE